ncbi:MAG: hypothetical protein WAL35_03170 [Acidimicrobiales bacterium]
MIAFPPELYRDAAALVTATANDDDESAQAILDEVGVALVLPLADLLVDTLSLYAGRCKVDLRTVLEITGQFAAEQSADAP